MEVKAENAGESIPEIGEYILVSKFGLGFYDLDEITAQIFALIHSIENLNCERKSPPKKG